MSNQRTFVTSDLHFGHANIMKFCPVTRARYNGDVEFMNESMVQEWNALVSPEDVVYILGDVAFLPAQKAVSYLHRLNGSKILIEGNHDRKLLNDKSFRQCFDEVTAYKRLVYQDTLIIMSHYPFLEWDQMHRGSLHFFGHVHGGTTGQEQYRCMDVGMDATGAIVVDIQTAIDRIKDNAIRGHH